MPPPRRAISQKHFRFKTFSTILFQPERWKNVPSGQAFTNRSASSSSPGSNSRISIVGEVGILRGGCQPVRLLFPADFVRSSEMVSDMAALFVMLVVLVEISPHPTVQHRSNHSKRTELLNCLLERFTSGREGPRDQQNSIATSG
jgi:hypothetical protein